MRCLHVIIIFLCSIFPCSRFDSQQAGTLFICCYVTALRARIPRLDEKIRVGSLLETVKVRDAELDLGQAKLCRSSRCNLRITIPQVRVGSCTRVVAGNVGNLQKEVQDISDRVLGSGSDRSNWPGSDGYMASHGLSMEPRHKSFRLRKSRQHLEVLRLEVLAEVPPSRQRTGHAVSRLSSEVGGQSARNRTRQRDAQPCKASYVQLWLLARRNLMPVRAVTGSQFDL